LTKDNFLFALIGLLFGFITGYLMHEVMATRQPARRMAGDPAAVTAGPAEASADSAAGAPPGAAPGAAGAPAVAEVRELQARLQKNPKDEEAIIKLANLNFDIRNFSRAGELYDQYLKIHPGQPDVMTDLGICIKETGQPEKALELFRQAQKIAPEHWLSVFNEVVVLSFDLKRFDEADRALAHLRQLQPGNEKVEQLAAEIIRRRQAAA
jgi:tetratricopeptide (TPR) repeat protein